jgi:ATP-dependent Lhr-like helicase
LTAPKLAERVLSLSPFKAVTFDQYRELLRYLIDTEHLEYVEGGGLIVGSASERMVNNYRFYATFEDDTSYMVREGSREIGNIQTLPAVGDRFRLAGRAWKVEAVDEDKKIIQVQRVRGKAQAYWTGGGAAVHTRILERVREVLTESEDYGYLQPRSVKRLASARYLASASDMLNKSILDMGGNRFMILPWKGSKIIGTICLLLEYGGINIRTVGQPFYLEVQAPSAATLVTDIRRILNNLPPSEQLVEKLPRQALQMNKYDRFVPELLLRTAYCKDVLDIENAVDCLESIIN